MPKLVVTIDGFSGAGKTSFATSLADRVGATLVSVDELVHEFPYRQKCILESDSPIRDLAGCWFRFEELYNLVGAFKRNELTAILTPYEFEKNALAVPQSFSLSPKILVIDGIFSATALRSRELSDKSIVMLADIEEADHRRCAREQRRWGERWQSDDHPQSYIHLFKAAFDEYLPSALSTADIVLLN